MFQKTMRGRIALQKHFVRNLYVDDFILRSSPRDESIRPADFGSAHCLPAGCPRVAFAEIRRSQMVFGHVRVVA
jgi:hypothetical protein